MLKTNNNNLLYTWDFANNGYYQNDTNYYIISSNGEINNINFNNILFCYFTNMDC